MSTNKTMFWSQKEILEKTQLNSYTPKKQNMKTKAQTQNKLQILNKIIFND